MDDECICKYGGMFRCMDACMHVFMYSLIIFFFVFKGIDIKRGGGVILLSFGYNPSMSANKTFLHRREQNMRSRHFTYCHWKQLNMQL